jgi:hypothetical protein
MFSKRLLIRLENKNQYILKNFGLEEPPKNKFLEKPKNENAKIWRYLNFTKFISILDRKALFFVRADRLSDKFEGSFSFPKDIVSLIKEISPSTYKEYFKLLQKNTSELMHVNCWCLGKYESSAMWKLYLKSDEGIAIQSTYKRLLECFNKNSVYKEGIEIGKIKYIEYGKDLMPPNIYLPFLYKRKSFEYEKELRAIIILISDEQIEEPKDKKNKKPENDLASSGIYIPIDLDILIEKIYISPTSEKWFKDLVESIVKKYKLKIVVKQSDLSKDPVL